MIQCRHNWRSYFKFLVDIVCRWNFHEINFNFNFAKSNFFETLLKHTCVRSKLHGEEQNIHWRLAR